MNKSAEQHLAKAKEFIAKGDEFYRQAKVEIDLAYQVPGTRQIDIAKAVGKSQQWVADVLAWDGEGTLYGQATEARSIRMAKQVLRESTDEQAAEIVGSLPSHAVAKVAKAVSNEYVARGQNAKRKADEALRESVGGDLIDGLTQQQRLHDSESLAFDARRALRDMLVLLNEADLDDMPDAWREDFLKTLDDLATRIDLARALISGTLDEDLARFLAEV